MSTLQLNYHVRQVAGQLDAMAGEALDRAHAQAACSHAQPVLPTLARSNTSTAPASPSSSA